MIEVALSVGVMVEDVQNPTPQNLTPQNFIEWTKTHTKVF